MWGKVSPRERFTGVFIRTPFGSLQRLKSILKKEGWSEDQVEECWYQGPEVDLGDSVFLCWDKTLTEPVRDGVSEDTSKAPQPVRSQSTKVCVCPLPKSERLQGECSEGVLPKYGRLFSDADLDNMETCEQNQKESTLGVTTFKSEEEEYDKGLEDRLYPLDEVELLRRRVKNAETQKKPSLEEVSLLLNLPLDNLQRNQSVSTGNRGSSAYWVRWFREALATSEEAKRANRDFRKTTSLTTVPVVVASVHEPLAKEITTPRRERSKHPPMFANSAASESTVLRNVEVSFELEEKVSMISEEIKEVDYFVKMRKDLVRTVTRKAVYRMLQEAMTKARKEDPPDKAHGSGCSSNPPPLSEDVPGIDWERLRWFAKLIVEEAKLRGDYWEPLVRWVDDYYPKNVVRIWQTLCSRTPRGETRSARRRKRSSHRKKVCFDCSSLYGQQAEALADTEFRANCDDDVSHYVNVVSGPTMEAVLQPKVEQVGPNVIDLLEVVTMRSTEADRDFLPVVGDGRRVVCTVGRFEASSSGYIDHLPVRMLADTGATLNLVDSAVLTRIGKTSYPLYPYEGRVSSSSGHALHIEGWTHLPIQLGTLELTLEVLVVGKLHIEAILGVDALGAFGALIDVANRSMLLQRSGETLQLGVEAIENTYLTTMASSVRLPPLGQALVLTNLLGGTPDGSAVLVEAVMNLPPAFGVARSLGTVKNGQVVLEICNVSTEEYWMEKGSTIAAASVVPGSAFNFENGARP
ncbi:putative membrane protein [Phytophthora megakarya]|uniref:Putative membrane protein n=1 Tax=Phytophthora megakarya TaxID=4795 RepID=A0A225W554_9STRA|nr:putative membrane protein [Phytophthora megakarya]